MPEPVKQEPQAPSTPSTPSAPAAPVEPTNPAGLEGIRQDVERAYESITKPPEPETGPTGEPPDTRTAEERARDEKGRFKKEPKKPKEPGAPPEPEAQGEAGEEPLAPASSPAEPVVEEPPPPDPTERAPQAWKAIARESWAKVPKEVRGELLRREHEVNERLQAAARYRQTAEQVESIWKPYEGLFRMSGRSPVETTKFLFDTAAALQQGPPLGKAQAMAQAIRQYGVDVELLAAALNGEAPPPGYAPPVQGQGYQDPRVDQLIARQEAAERQRSEQELRKTQAHYAEFAKNHEFFEDVREAMADIVSLKAEQGVDIDDETAYKMAVALDPELTAIVQQREKAKQAANPSGSTQRAAAAAVSLRSGGPAPAHAPPVSDSKDPRGDVAAAWDKVMGGQRA